ncbi:MAG: nitrogen fixation protein FixH [Comamonadaceae bacterium]|nr:MAG: nitrogen fixation protein FixH [Comamonadaceae bacterium]
MHTIPATPPAPAPWWKYGYVWMIIAGPAAVVVAGFATLWIAMANPETLVDQDYYRRGVEINKTLEAARQAKALMPAVQGRNHAATPVTGGP